MRDYSHEEFVNLVAGLSEEQLLDLSANYGGYPVLFRMALDERLSHIPFIQTGSAVVVENEKGERFCKHLSFQNGELSRYDQFHMDTWFKGSKPIAWMPLPEAYNPNK